MASTTRFPEFAICASDFRLRWLRRGIRIATFRCAGINVIVRKCSGQREAERADSLRWYSWWINRIASVWYAWSHLFICKIFFQLVITCLSSKSTLLSICKLWKCKRNYFQFSEVLFQSFHFLTDFLHRSVTSQSLSRLSRKQMFEVKSTCVFSSFLVIGVILF